MTLDQLDFFSAIDSSQHSQLLTPREVWLRFTPQLVAAFREGKRVEYKSARRISLDETAKYYSAFSNTVDGGVLVFGVEDSGELTGCAKMTQEQINALESFHVQLCPGAVPEHKKILCTVKGASDFLIAIYIPYRGYLVETNKGEAYIRYGDNKHLMSLEEKQDFRSTRHERSYELMDSPLSYPEDFDSRILADLCESFRSRELKPDWTNEEVLIDRELLHKAGGSYVARNALVLIAAKNPRIHIPGCRVRVQRFSTTEEGAGPDFNPIRDIYIEGNIVRILSRALDIINPLNYDVTWLSRDGKFITTSEYPQWAWFEALVNACVHRSYSFSGSEITVKFFPDRLEVESPGGFVPPVNAMNIYSQRASRNPFMMDALRFLGYVRMTREGTRRMRQSMIDWYLPEPAFSQETIHGVAVRVTLRNDQETRKRSTDKDVATYCGVELWKQLSEHEIAIMGYAFRNKFIQVAEASRLTGRTWNTSKKDLDRLVTKGLLAFEAPKFTRDPKAHYSTIDQPTERLGRPLAGK